MSPTPSFPRTIIVKFTGAATNDPVTVTNTETGEIMNKDTDGNELRLEAKDKGILFNANNFTQGVTTGDVLTVSVGGAKAATTQVTTTSGAAGPVESTVTATAVSTAVLTI